MDFRGRKETKPARMRSRAGVFAMMIYMLAAVMTVAMLIATALALHQESEEMRLSEKKSRLQGFGSH
jgi:hypothetical protein